ncbi:MAG: CxxC-x17-CxxC domain-containing protein [Patescibacteria group bacterium]
MAFRRFEDRQRRDFAPRQMHQGDWACSECSAKITELPFEPSADRPIFCRDCWMKKRDERTQR